MLMSSIVSAAAEASGAADRGTEWWEVAIPAGSGLAGVIVGGLITRWVTLAAEDRRAKLERELAAAAATREAERLERERVALAKAVVRVLVARYRQLDNLMTQSLNQGVWPTHLMETDPPLPYEDRKLLAGTLPSQALSDIDV